MGAHSLVLQGRIIPAGSYQELLLSGLQTIELFRPGTLALLARDKGRSKRIVSRERDGLYDRPGPGKSAQRIDGGWWVATNNSGDEVEKFIRRAAVHAGIEVEIRR